jgi:hypothetical protein
MVNHTYQKYPISILSLTLINIIKSFVANSIPSSNAISDIWDVHKILSQNEESVHIESAVIMEHNTLQQVIY